MSETQLIYTINQNRQMKRQFHALELPKRRKLISELAGHLDERTFQEALRRVKREKTN